MSERAPGRLLSGILESAAIVLAVAVATLVMARVEPGQQGCVAATAPTSRIDARAKPAADAEDMLLHD
ncbi:hypothetical protein EN829_021205 [Mesorhizobium sp. M00.F.Ca.ET.186.01.1.1]|nr:hypothetical protein EN848_28150 [bacterium M00.F.Ca.ET.205.01.1.1]TGU50525.1 hypothetical protein EN795_23250 [bacterium M00.F.Ca.ET.152.01.1.1]TGV33988.1 hypothetical protein EN829_021205 [Mesorhizobium sp. M00.F.Ca.ET.186.01.1.1]TGZ40889.1 hypothetical protein EN805_22645 [bacterium M00.F.Ca.ET.162.01.1.1]